MKKRLTSFILAAALIMSLPMAVSATESTPAGSDPVANAVYDAGDNARLIASSTINADRTSNTSGNVTAYAAFTTTATKATCTIYLQEKYNGLWRTATGLTTTSYKKTVYNTNSITAGKTFTLKSSNKEENSPNSKKSFHSNLNYILFIAFSIATGEFGDKTFLASIGLRRSISSL